MNKKIILFSSISGLIGLALAFFLINIINYKPYNPDNRFIELLVALESDNNQYKIRSIEDLINEANPNIKGNNRYYESYNTILSIENTIQSLKTIINSGRSLNENEIMDFISALDIQDTDLREIIFSVFKSKSTQTEKLLYLNFIQNILLEEEILNFNSRLSPFSYGNVINIAAKDTVSYGETYTSSIIFNVEDVRGNMIIMDNGDTIRGGKFEEKVTQFGHNTKKGYLRLLVGDYTTLVYEVNIDYYVK